jgi:hypothetical protein
LGDSATVFDFISYELRPAKRQKNMVDLMGRKSSLVSPEANEDDGVFFSYHRIFES